MSPLRFTNAIKTLFQARSVCTRESPSFIKLCQRRSVSIKVNSQDRSQFSQRGYILLFAPILTFGLGTWQIQRRKWKLDLIDRLERKTHAAPVDFPEDYINDLPGLEYQRVKVRGKFDHSREILMGPRSLVKEEKSRRGLMTQGGNAGYHVITPFRIVDRGITILVNRGWVSGDQRDHNTRESGQINGIVDLVGVVRLHENRPQFAPKIASSSGVWHFRDLNKMAENLNCEPVFLDADMNSTVNGGPVGGQTRVSLRNEHFSYIVTWYSLSAATMWMWYNRFGRKFMFK